MINRVGCFFSCYDNSSLCIPQLDSASTAPSQFMTIVVYVFLSFDNSSLCTQFCFCIVIFIAVLSDLQSKRALTVQNNKDMADANRRSFRPANQNFVQLPIIYYANDRRLNSVARLAICSKCCPYT